MYRLLPFFFGISVVMGAQFRSDYLHRYKFFEEVDGWLKLHIVPAKWNDARLRCFLEGGNLASPVSKQMQDIMMYIQKERSVYTGISATFSKHDYFTVEGVPLSNIPADWLPGQPDNCEDKESCVIIHPNGGMDDVKCTEVHAYICYKKDTKTTMTECGTVDLGNDCNPFR